LLDDVPAIFAEEANGRCADAPNNPMFKMNDSTQTYGDPGFGKNPLVLPPSYRLPARQSIQKVAREKPKSLTRMRKSGMRFA
jgi:hypothetical protein